MPKKLIQELVELNRSHSERFMGPGQAAARRRYRAEHPTEIVCLKCMDGRINMPILTHTPMGVMQPFRNIGGIFDLGWPALSMRLSEIVDYSIANGRHNLFLVTYHWSAGNEHRGCRGQNYCLDRAVGSAVALVDQIEAVYGSGHEQVYPVVVGIETDGEGLVFHDALDTRRAEIRGFLDADDAKFRELIGYLYPDMHPRVRADLLPLMAGNAEHLRQGDHEHRPEAEMCHRERIIAVGQGFDWLHKPNLALIIGDFDPRLNETIAKAAGIIQDNREKGRIPDTEALLFASVSYRNPGHERSAAVTRAMWLTDLGMESIRKLGKNMTPFFHPVTAVCNGQTRAIEIIRE